MQASDPREILLPEDQSAAPPIRPKSVRCATGRVHTFRLLDRRYALEVVVIADDDGPLADVGIELATGNGRVMRSKTDAIGRVRFEGLNAEPYTLTLYQLDQDAWELVGDMPLPEAKARSKVEAAWTSSPTQDQAEGSVHEVVQGECLPSLAALHGFLPRTLWKAPQNEVLRAEGKSQDVLSPGVRITLPPRRLRRQEVCVGRRYYIHRIGVPFLLALRMLDSFGRPRRWLQYKLEIATRSDGLLKTRLAATDSDGYLFEPVPPDATGATLAFETGSPLRLRFSHLDPVSDVSGIRARLENLGYSCGGESGEIGAKTQEALRRFQLAHGLEDTGEADDATRELLQERHLS